MSEGKTQSETERLAIDHPESGGVEIERGVEPTSLQNCGEHATVQLRRSDGGIEEVTCPERYREFIVRIMPSALDWRSIVDV